MDCFVCKKPATIHCTNCCKRSYCNKKHERSDKESHITNCYPFEIVGTNDFVATRDIKDGEMIMSDAPFLMAPGYPNYYLMSDIPFSGICLGCYCTLDRRHAFRCKRCKFPVCSERCSNEMWHRKYECTLDIILKRLAAIDNPLVYYYITIFRFLLLKELEPRVWERVSRQFEFFRKSLSINKLQEAKTISLKMKKLCKRTKYNLPLWTITDIIGVLTRNGIYSTPQTVKDRCCTSVYQMAVMFPHKCTPNIGYYQTYVPSNKRYELKYYAASNILAGTKLTQSMETSYILMGTDHRRLKMQLDKNYNCRCERCMDPTEFGTYFSGRKCVTENCDGYLLPIVQSTTLTTQWQCNNDECNAYELNEGTSICDLHTEVKGMFFHIQCNLAQQTPFETVQKLGSVLENYSKTLHPNHYLIFTGEHILLDHLVAKFKNFNEPSAFNCAEIILKVCTKILRLYNKLMPGSSYLRGRVLFYLSRGVKYFVDIYVMPDSNKNGKMSVAGMKYIPILQALQEHSLMMLTNYPDDQPVTCLPTEKMIKTLKEEIDSDFYKGFDHLFQTSSG